MKNQTTDHYRPYMYYHEKPLVYYVTGTLQTIGVCMPLYEHGYLALRVLIGYGFSSCLFSYCS